MLRFFRHIRQKLFLEGKASRYLGYALGEIVLIVVGILIALNIQNWNEERKQRDEESQILSRISSELKEQSDMMHRFEERIAQKNAALDAVLQNINGKPILDNATFLSNVNTSTFLSWAHPQFRRSTFDEVASSGKLGLIRNVELRDAISNWYQRLISMETSISARTIDYAVITNGLIRTPYLLSYFTDRESSLEAMDQQELAAMVEAIMTANLSQPMISEINRMAYIRRQWEIAEARIDELKAAIDAELAAN